MRYRTLGRTGFEVSEIGYGAWGIGGYLWVGSDDRESLAALRRALDLGLNFIDTALAYGSGHSEQLVGQVVRESGKQVYVATKIPPKNRLWPARPGMSMEEVFPYDYIIHCTEESLRHLGLPVIDVQQFHVWNPEWVDHDDWKRAFADLKRSGKVRAFGISINDYEPDSALGVINTGLIDCVQVIYNIYEQAPEQNLFPLCQRQNIGVIVRVPLDEGGLTGNITEDSQFDPKDFRHHYFSGDRKRQVVERANALNKDLAEVKGSLPEIALRFCLSHPAVSTVIPGMRKVRNVEVNCAVSDKGPLDGKTLEMLKLHAWPRNFYA